jgi:hypothetical protein
MEYGFNGGAVNPPVLKTIDGHSVPHKKSSRAAKACDAADWLDGLTNYQNPTLRVASVACDVSVSSIGLARRLTPAQRQEVRAGLRPLRQYRKPNGVPMLPTAQQRLADIVSELGGIASARNELAAIERNNGNGHAT